MNYAAITDSDIKALSAIVGDENASFSVEGRLCYAYDATNRDFMPDAVLFPATAEEISGILKLASARPFPVIARGAGSGFTGGSVPVEGGVVISTERMSRIIEISTENMTAVVEPGLVNGDLQTAVEEKGLFYPPDPSSLKFSTIGGNIAECAGGPRAVKYGVTRDYVLGLEVVLPTGEIIETGVRTMKGVVGYDLTRLIVGSEGTLGVVTRATLRLVTLPEKVKTMLALFPSLSSAASTVNDILLSKALPSTLEIIDGACIRAIRDFSGGRALPEAEALLLIEIDGTEEAVLSGTETVREICVSGDATEVRIAGDAREARGLWQARRAISPSLKKIKPDKLNEDVVVPRSEIPALIEGIQNIASERGVIIASFGHAGDGNIHVNIMIDSSDPDEDKRGKEAVRDVFELTLKLGGTISGEHGVGTAKAPYLGMELTPDVIALMRRVKDSFDPNGILNPGKIFSQASE